MHSTQDDKEPRDNCDNMYMYKHTCIHTYVSYKQCIGPKTTRNHRTTVTIYIYIYISIYVCVCVCVCMSVYVAHRV